MTTALREHVAAAARRAAHEGLLIGTAGNVSARVDDVVAVTASGVALGGCRAEDVTVVTPTGDVLEGDLLPTSELSLHLGIYADTDAAAVVHTHAAYSTAVACVLDELPVLHYQQLLLGGPVPVAPYATFGTPELASHVRTALAGRQAVLMANHGSVAVGASLDAAVEHALLLEWLAELYHRAALIGPPRALTQEQQDAVVAQAVHLRYGTPQSLQENQ
jgi:L-fuculose-phosphate aldolase